MEDLNYNRTNFADEIEEVSKIQLLEDIKKTLDDKKNRKTYKVTLQYIKIPEEEAKIKLSIIESIIRKGYND